MNFTRIIRVALIHAMRILALGIEYDDMPKAALILRNSSTHCVRRIRLRGTHLTVTHNGIKRER